MTAAVTRTLSKPESVFPDQYGGIGRASWFFLQLLSGFAGNGVSFTILVWLAPMEPEPHPEAFGSLRIAAAVAGTVVSWIAGLVFTAKRLQNLGYDPAWCLGMFIPLFNLLIGWRCLCAPEGYADRGSLDGAGRLTSGLLICFIWLCMLLCYGVYVAGVHKAKEEVSRVLLGPNKQRHLTAHLE